MITLPAVGTAPKKWLTFVGIRKGEAALKANTPIKLLPESLIDDPLRLTVVSPALPG